MFENFIAWFKNHFRPMNPNKVVNEEKIVDETVKTTPFVRKANAQGLRKGYHSRQALQRPRVIAADKASNQISAVQDSTNDVLLSALIVSEIMKGDSSVHNTSSVESFTGGGGESGGGGASGSWEDNSSEKNNSSYDSGSSSDSSSSE